MDALKLEYERKKKGLSTEDFCKEIGISRSAYYRKCTGKSEFTQSEIQKICTILSLESPMSIFFTSKVS